jgi:4-hydroxy-4-methyl-2-oxoglutarate aldolase
MRWSGLLLLFPLALSAQVLEVSSSALSEGAEQVVGKRAHMTGEIRLLAGTRLAGPAVTIRLVPDETAPATEAGLAAIRVLEAAPAGSVIVAALGGDPDHAVFGATFAALAKSHRLAGFVVDGAVRDLADLKQMTFPTLARSAAPGTAGGHYRIVGTNIPVECGGIEVRPGDIVVADEDGVAVAPRERYADILAAAQKWQSEKRALIPLIEKYGSYLKALQDRGSGGKRQ